MSDTAAKVSILDLPSMVVAGLGADFISALVRGSNAHEVLPKLWADLNAIIEATAIEGQHAYDFQPWMIGAMGEPELPAYAEAVAVPAVEGLLNYFAGVRVDSIDRALVDALVAAGLQLRSFEGGSFAVCEHVGPLDRLGETTAWFYQTWLPTQGPAERFGHHFEIYDERFKMGSPSSVVMICAPVQK